MANAIPAVQKSAAKKIYYVMKNRDFGFYSLSSPCFHGGNRLLATKFSSIEELLAAYGRNAIFGTKTYSSNLDIIRVEETAGVPSRRVASCSETPTGYAIKDGPTFLSNPGEDFGLGWVYSLKEAKLYSSEQDAVQALTERASRLRTTYRSQIVRVIDVPGTPVIDETVLA